MHLLPRYYTLQEFLTLEAASEQRHEYIEGRVYATEYDTKSHNLTKNNLIAALRPGVRQRGCQVFSTSVQLEAQAGSSYFYPDVLASCDPADRRDPYLLRQPVFISEILSSTTAEYDRTEKFACYQKIPSLRHYLLVSQSAWTVEWFRRDEAGQWIYTLLAGPDDTLEILDLGLVLPLRELYEETDVAPLQVLPSVEQSGMSPLEPSQN
ncbi:MAG: Uma2 family endonuclease [Janthinobacterium lividum]